jgi:hypothetical protein
VKSDRSESGSVTGRVALDRRTIHISDALTDPEYTLSMSGDRGYRTILGVPLLRRYHDWRYCVDARHFMAIAEKQIQLPVFRRPGGDRN